MCRDPILAGDKMEKSTDKLEIIEVHDDPIVFPAKVAKVQDETNVVINRGSNHGVKKGQRFMIYRVTDEMLQDPDTGEELGKLEIALGTGKVIYVQDKWATIESDQPLPPQSRIVKRPIGSFAFMGNEEITESFSEGKLPFNDPERGDYAKPI